MKKFIIGCALALASVMAQAAAPLVINGTFENGLTGWTQSGNTAYQSVFAQKSGNHSFSDGAIGQVGYLNKLITTIAGSHYDLSFDLRSTTENGVNHSEVVFGDLVAGSVKDNFYLPTFQHFTFTNLLATGNATLLQFAFQNSESFILLDNVALQVSAVPEPVTYLMLLMGLGLITLVKRRRSR
ncbi:hypothetical protein RCH09_000067 [Actimicrobium sp. GrIS 1.19]|uniref:PEP-CTERM sorting domain-containing protein n=1 Tax=Actimicrobium sp. GrIS 1.19 TaxID=3071708 RepID=UPI002E07EC3F|nr:hypothetical protein [Actimicrobium sp. GrIS 1.19]